MDKSFQEFFNDILAVRGLTIEKLAELTEVPKHYLDALSSGNFEKLPAVPYTRGFLSKIAEVLAIDGDELWRTYKDEITLNINTSDKLPFNRFAIRRFGKIKIIIGIILISVIIYLVWQSDNLLGIPKIEIAKKIGIIGIALILLGLIWSIIFPINKSLWTSSYVLYSAGIATVCLTLLYCIIDIANYKKWTTFFLIWGVNPMIVFFFSGIIPRVLSSIKIQNPEADVGQINLQNLIYNFWIEPFFKNPLDASLTYALIYAVFWSLILWFFYKKRMIFKV